MWGDGKRDSFLFFKGNFFSLKKKSPFLKIGERQFSGDSLVIRVFLYLSYLNKLNGPFLVCFMLQDRTRGFEPQFSQLRSLCVCLIKCPFKNEYLVFLSKEVAEEVDMFERVVKTRWEYSEGVGKDTETLEQAPCLELAQPYQQLVRCMEITLI